MSYRVRRNARARRITVRIVGGQVLVTAPPRVPMDRIAAFVAQEDRWLRAALARDEALTPRPLVAGDQIPLVGGWLALERGDVRVARRDADRLILPRSADVSLAVESWYRRSARVHFGRLLDLWSPRIGVTPARLAIRGQRARWGSAAATGTISINWRLMTAPPEIGAYVMVHELVHLLHMNHSPTFWACVAAHWPDHRDHQAWLRAHGARVLAGPHPRHESGPRDAFG